jgi:hypothetical protein
MARELPGSADASYIDGMMWKTGLASAERRSAIV